MYQQSQNVKRKGTASVVFSDNSSYSTKRGSSSTSGSGDNNSSILLPPLPARNPQPKNKILIRLTSDMLGDSESPPQLELSYQSQQLLSRQTSLRGFPDNPSNNTSYYSNTINNNNNSSTKSMDEQLIEGLIGKVQQLEGHISNLSSNLHQVNYSVSQLSQSRNFLQGEVNILKAKEDAHKYMSMQKLNSSLEYVSCTAIESLIQSGSYNSVSDQKSNHQLSQRQQQLNQQQQFQKEYSQDSQQDKQKITSRLPRSLSTSSISSSLLRKASQQTFYNNGRNIDHSSRASQHAPSKPSAQSKGSNIQSVYSSKEQHSRTEFTPVKSKTGSNTYRSDTQQKTHTIENQFLQNHNMDMPPQKELIDDILKKKSKSSRSPAPINKTSFPTNTQKSNNKQATSQTFQIIPSLRTRSGYYAQNTGFVEHAPTGNQQKKREDKLQQHQLLFQKLKSIQQNQHNDTSSSKNKSNKNQQQSEFDSPKKEDFYGYNRPLDLSQLKNIISNNPSLNRPVINISFNDC